MSTNKKQRRILITAALPYANGPIHLGHLLEYIQADIWARFQRERGHDCLYLCGDDAHGTPIMITAEQHGITPEALIAQVHDEHNRDLNGFLVAFDHFYTTHSPENKMLSELIYHRIQAKGDLFEKTISQAYDPVKEMFLPDRFIRGTCPNCHADNQYGDVCEVCGSTYTPMELINPISIVSNEKPIKKTSTHLFFSLEHYTDLLKQWVHSGRLQSTVANKLKEWFQTGLKPWDISRDAPYFGFPIPDKPNKYFYVWLDAPIGYMATLKHLANQRDDIHFDDYWVTPNNTELYHFIGKDIIYFHALFWPAVLHSADFRLPSGIFAHGYLTIHGKKMSKSRGTFITASDYLNHLDPEYLRYYFATKLSHHVEDIDLNLNDFMQRVNADLVGKYVNLASRCTSFIHKYFADMLSDTLDNLILYDSFIQAADDIAKHYEHRDYHKVIHRIMALADLANQYINEKKPWGMAKENAHDPKIQAICTQGLNLFKILSIYLKPILPNTSKKVEAFLNLPPLTWESLQTPTLNHRINAFTPLITRVDQTGIDQLTHHDPSPSIQ